MTLDPAISDTTPVDQEVVPCAAPLERIELSVVMPCLNERETVAICVQKATAALQSAGIDGEVIVADNGSTDGSIALAQSEGARVIHVSGQGLRQRASRRH